jgi:hypothetical protein
MAGSGYPGGGVTYEVELTPKAMNDGLVLLGYTYEWPNATTRGKRISLATTDPEVIRRIDTLVSHYREIDSEAILELGGWLSGQSLLYQVEGSKGWAAWWSSIPLDMGVALAKGLESEGAIVGLMKTNPRTKAHEMIYLLKRDAMDSWVAARLLALGGEDIRDDGP